MNLLPNLLQRYYKIFKYPSILSKNPQLLFLPQVEKD